MKSNYRGWSIEPKTAEEIKDSETPNGMRKLLRRYSYEDSMTRSIFDAAAARGYSGEDTMTWLAFEALRRVERLEDLALGNYAITPMQHFFLKPNP